MKRLHGAGAWRWVLVATAIACFGPHLARAQATPPWGPVAYQAEIATYLDDELVGRISIEAGAEGLRYVSLDADGAEMLVFVLAWDGVDVTAWMLDDGGFAPADAFLATVLAAVVDPLAPDIGSCAVQAVACSVVGEDEVGGRSARRVEIDLGAGGRSTVWVDARTGLAIAGEGMSDGVAVRTELWRFVEEAPDPARLRP